MTESKPFATGNSNRIDTEDLNELLKIGFKDFNIDLSGSDDNDIIQKPNRLSLPKEKDYEYSTVVFDFDDFFEIDISSSSENKINIKRQETLKSEFTSNLLGCLSDEDFEFGIRSRSEMIIREQFSVNTLATRNWLNEIFIENFPNEKILLGLLRIIGRFEEEIISRKVTQWL
tara:strand:+ start:85 stop:603 length:519 start_codon:yes stop_codon:yes gene_type:complete